MAESDARADLGHDDFLQLQEEDRLRQRVYAEAKAVSDALGDGQLKELAAYLDGGAAEMPGLPEAMVAIPRWLADEIIAMIEGEPWCWFRLTPASQKRGRTRSDDLAAAEERFRVGYFVEMRLRQPGTKHEMIVEEARAKFEKGRTYVTDAHKEVRGYLDEMSVHGLDGWRELAKRSSPPKCG